MRNHGLLLALALLLPPWSAGAGAETDADARLLQEHGIPVDAGGLLHFFRQRTLSEDQLRRIRDLIQQLGDAQFIRRDRASKDLVQFGSPASPLLEKALATPADLETGRRLQTCVAAIRKKHPASLPLAAVRLLRQKAPPQAAAVLLDYLPFANDRGVEEEILIGLPSLSWREGRAVPALASALKAELAARRGAAGFVLGRSPDAGQRKAVRALLKDADPWVRLRAAQGLVAGQDKAAIPTLLDLLAVADGDLAWRAEEILQRIAGDKAPFLDYSPDQAKKNRALWQAWWRDHAPAIDLAKLPEGPSSLGFTLAIEYNTNRIWECTPDRKKRWTISANGPMDAQILPGQRVLIAETNQVTERDFHGNILWRHQVNGDPVNCQRLANGHTFIGTRNDALIVRKDNTVVSKYKITDLPLNGVRRLANGHFVGLTYNGIIEEIDAAGNKVRTVKIPEDNETWGDVDGLPGGRYLVACYGGGGRLLEVDSTGKKLWELKVPGVCGVERLANGRFLCGCQTQVLEVTRTGQVAWKTTTTDQGWVRRIHRR